MNRDTTWHELYDRMSEKSCPICSLIVTRKNALMKFILYEGVNDRGVRAQLCDSDGICNVHAYQMLDLGDPLAHAIIYSDILNRFIDDTGVLREPVASVHEKCYFCQSLDHSESAYVKAFALNFADEEFRNKYIEHGIVCVPHNKAVLAKIKDPALQLVFKNASKAQYRDLIGNLSEIKRKSDYRNSKEAWTAAEKEAWKKVVAIVNGYQGKKADRKHGKQK